MYGFSSAILLKAAFKGLATESRLNNTILLLIILGIVGLIFVSNLIHNSNKGRNKSNRRYNRFMLRKTAANMGLQPPHIQLMENFIKKLHISHPVLLFSNRKMLDNFLKRGIHIVERSADKSPEEKAAYIRTIFEIKEKIEMQSRRNIGLKSTHLIKPDQMLTVLTEEGKSFHCQVANNLSSVLVCTYSAINRYHVKNLKRGMKIKVFFWRENDTGYSFVSRIAGFDPHNRASQFYIRHTTQLSKEQQRKHQRRPVKLNCYLYPVEIQGRNRRKKRKNIKVMYDIRFLGVLHDISALGCRVSLRHAFEKEQLLKIQFSMDRESNVSALGRVKNCSAVRGQGYMMSLAFKKISNKARNAIYTYVFNFIEEQE